MPDRYLTLSQVAEQTGISEPTLRRYRKTYGDRIPTVAEKGTTRFAPEAVDVIATIRAQKKKPVPAPSVAKKAAERSSTKKGSGQLPKSMAKLHVAKPASGREILEALSVSEAEIRSARRAAKRAGL